MISVLKLFSHVTVSFQLSSIVHILQVARKQKSVFIHNHHIYDAVWLKSGETVGQVTL